MYEHQGVLSGFQTSPLFELPKTEISKQVE